MEDLARAVELLEDKNLVWSEDFESIRKHLADLLAKAKRIEYAVLEPEIGDLALKLIRGEDVRRPKATDAD
jgi:hypothetical protein